MKKAVYMDPLSSAVLSLDEIDKMCEELFEANKEFLVTTPNYNEGDAKCP